MKIYDNCSDKYYHYCDTDFIIMRGAHCGEIHWFTVKMLPLIELLKLDFNIDTANWVSIGHWIVYIIYNIVKSSKWYLYCNLFVMENFCCFHVLISNHNFSNEIFLFIHWTILWHLTKSKHTAEICAGTWSIILHLLCINGYCITILWIHIWLCYFFCVQIIYVIVVSKFHPG